MLWVHDQKLQNHQNSLRRRGVAGMVVEPGEDAL
jgi:hypothetical protein